MFKFLKMLPSITLILVFYYFLLPPLNLSSPIFWFYFITSIMIIKINLNFFQKSFSLKRSGIFISIITISILVLLFINIMYSPLFNSNTYANRIEIVESDFNTDVKPVDFESLALIDKDSTSKLGDRVMGQMTDLVSQFYVSDLYTQINYQNSIVRVTPLEYASVIKYFTNRKNGVAGYITVNSVNGEANLVKLEKGMKYVPSALFFENLYRKLRISYPTEIFGDVNFELDEEGNPYFIVETIKYKGIGLIKEVSGVVVLNPIDGTSSKYVTGSIPTWIDHVYSPDLIIEQVDDWGKYKNGFINSIFSQKEVVMTTTGYNYLAQDDDIYLYTGITSVSSDESNIGFILTNMRTKETKFYGVAGAEEYSAMASSEGQVQQMKYTSTFPLLINLNNKPTYLMSLKDNAGLVKMYSFVDYKDYQKVVVTDASLGIVAAAENYLGGVIGDTKEKEITIKSLKEVIIDGTTYYYFKDDEIYRASIKINEKILPFIKMGDKIKIAYKESEINEITKILD